MCGTAAAASSRSTVMRTSSEPAARERGDLARGAFDIGRVGIRHGLDDDRRAAAHGDAADADCDRFVTFREAVLIQYRPNQYRHAEPCRPPGSGATVPLYRRSIVAGSARGWESLKPWVHPALWQISSWMPNPRHRRSARTARPAGAALQRYIGRHNRQPVRGNRCFRSAGTVSRSWCLLVGFVGRCARADNAFLCPSFQFRWWCVRAYRTICWSSAWNFAASIGFCSTGA